MLKYICLVAVLLCAGLAAAQPFDEYSQYLGKNVTVNVCNQTVYQGQVVELWVNSIVVRELCDPELGNVSIKKSCIVSIIEGFQCIN